jgi:hypothetical protein
MLEQLDLCELQGVNSNNTGAFTQPIFLRNPYISSPRGASSHPSTFGLHHIPDQAQRQSITFELLLQRFKGYLTISLDRYFQAK